MKSDHEKGVEHVADGGVAAAHRVPFLISETQSRDRN